MSGRRGDDRVALWVCDVERMSRFYQTVLGTGSMQARWRRATAQKATVRRCTMQDPGGKPIEFKGKPKGWERVMPERRRLRELLDELHRGLGDMRSLDAIAKWPDNVAPASTPSHLG